STARPDDWYFVMDADQVVVTVADDLKVMLEQADEDVAEARFIEPQAPIVHSAVREMGSDDTTRFSVRCLFRAQPGIYVTSNHYTYVTSSGKKLWGHATKDLEPSLDLSDLLEIEHRTHSRDQVRHDQQYAYYQRRSETNIERGACDVCGELATVTMP